MQPYPPSYVPAPAAAPRSSPLVKLAVGCALGCAALALVGLIAAGVGGWCVLRPGRQLSTATVVAPTAAGSFRVGDLGSDPGVAALLDGFVRASQRQQQAALPPWMRSLQQMGASAGSPTAGLRMMLPTEATVSIERGVDDQPAIVAAVNPRGLTFPLRVLLSRPQHRVETYHGREVLRLGDRAWAAALDGTFLFANDPQALRGGIDRLDARGTTTPPAVDLGAPPATRSANEPGGPAPTWDLTGSITGEDGELDRLLEIDGSRGEPSGARRVRVGIDVATGDLVVGRILVDCATAEAAAAAARALEQRARERAHAWAAVDLDLRAATRVDGTTATLDWELHGVQAALQTWMARTQPHRGDALR